MNTAESTSTAGMLIRLPTLSDSDYVICYRSRKTNQRCVTGDVKFIYIEMDYYSSHLLCRMSSDHACPVLWHGHTSDTSWTIMGMWWAQTSNTPLPRQQQNYTLLSVLNVTTMLLWCFSFIFIVAVYSESKSVGHDGLTITLKYVHRHRRRHRFFFWRRGRCCLFCGLLEINFITKPKNNQRNKCQKKYFCQCFSSL